MKAIWLSPDTIFTTSESERIDLICEDVLLGIIPEKLLFTDSEIFVEWSSFLVNFLMFEVL